MTSNGPRRLEPAEAPALVTPFDELDSARAQPTAALVAGLAAAVLGVVAALAGQARGAVALVLLLAGLVFALTWHRLVRAPGGRAGLVILTVVAVLLPALVGLGDGVLPLRWVPAVVAGGLIAAFLVQLGRPGRRARMIDGVAACVSGQALLVSGVTLVVAIAHAPALVAIGQLGTVIAVIVELLGGSPRLRPAVPWLLLVLTVAGGALLAVAVGVPWLLGAGCALLTATVGSSLRRVLGTLPTSPTVAGGVAEGLASVLVTGAMTTIFIVLLA